MPNYAFNTVICKGPCDEISAIRSMVRKALQFAITRPDENRDYRFYDNHLFSQLIPIPAELRDVKTDEYVMAVSDGDDYNQVRSRIREEEAYANLEKAVHCKKKYGYYSEYDFRCYEWGTKNYYDLYPISITDNLIAFNLTTAWRVPDVFLLRLSSVFPDTKIIVRTAEEEGGICNLVFLHGMSEIADESDESVIRVVQKDCHVLSALISSTKVIDDSYTPVECALQQLRGEYMETIQCTSDPDTNVAYTQWFANGYKKIVMRRKPYQRHVDELIRKLAHNEILSEVYHDHAISCPWPDLRECRIVPDWPDWFLVYRIQNDSLILVLVRKSFDDRVFDESLYNAYKLIADIKRGE